jgi:hypothetical protein
MTMEVGVLKTLSSEKEIQTDALTGNTVWQMTQGDAVNCSCYQEVEAFTADEQYVIFSSNRTGNFQLYRADLESGELGQLCDVADYREISFGMARNGREALYTAGWRVYAVDVATGEDRVVIDFEGKIPNQPSGAPVALSGNDDRVVVAYESEPDKTMLAFGFVETGEFHDIYEWSGKLTHAQICPGDSNLVTFDPGPDTQNDMSLPMEERARTWIVDIEKGEARPFLTMPYGFRATHEYWDCAGDRLYFHRKTVPGVVPGAICSINRAGEDWQEHFISPERRLGHSSIDRGNSFIISDVQCEGDNEMWRIDMKTGEGEVLCWPNTSYIQNQTVHVHPSISPPGNFIDFTSDRCGSSDVFIYPLNQ